MKPLADIRVVDFTEGAQGPFAASLLADLGCEVVKIERPGGEMMRRLGPHHGDIALPVLTICHGRVAVVELDIKEERGRDTILRLVARADLLIQNWKLGSEARIGLSFEDVRKLNPGIVYMRSTGYGTEGPLAAMGSMDHLSQAISGMSSLSGASDSSGERTRTPILDFISAFVTAEAAMIGLAERRRTGDATLVDTAQLSAALDALSPEVALANHGKVPPAGRQTRLNPLGGFFRCADGVFIAIECCDEDEMERLREAFGLASGEPLQPQLERSLAVIEARVALARCRAAVVSGAIVERAFDASLFDRFPGTVRTFHDGLAGEVRQPEAPYLFSATPIETGLPLGPVGRDNDLIDLLIARWDLRGRAASVPGSATAGTSTSGEKRAGGRG